MYDALSFAKQGEAYKYRIHEQCAAIGKRADVSRSDDISEMKSQIYDLTQMMHNMSSRQGCQPTGTCFIQKIYAPPLPYFKVNICHLSLPHFASIFFAYL